MIVWQYWFQTFLFLKHFDSKWTKLFHFKFSFIIQLYVSNQISFRPEVGTDFFFFNINNFSKQYWRGNVHRVRVPKRRVGIDNAADTQQQYLR